MNNLKSKILETVQKNNIKMIPKWKFVLYSALGIAGVWFTFLVLVFVVSLILFVLSRYGFMDMPFFGFMQTLHALGAIPFALFLAAIILLIVMEIISRMYTFTFRKPLSVTLLGITLVVAFSSYIVSQTPVHEYVRDYMKSHHLDMLSRAYDRPSPPYKVQGMDVLRGEVVFTTATSATVVLFNGERIIAYATTSNGTTTMPRAPRIGEDIVILGTFLNDKFEIIRIRPAHRGPFNTPVTRHHDGIRKEIMQVK
jgi:hypothetical protein